MGGLNELSRHVVDGHVFIMWPVIGVGYLWNCGDINMSKYPVTAFPTTEGNWPNENVRTEGMELRDYFAAKAINGILSDPASGLLDDDLERWAKISFKIADAMIKARNQ